MLVFQILHLFLSMFFCCWNSAVQSVDAMIIYRNSLLLFEGPFWNKKNSIGRFGRWSFGRWIRPRERRDFRSPNPESRCCLTCRCRRSTRGQEMLWRNIHRNCREETSCSWKPLHLAGFTDLMDVVIKKAFPIINISYLPPVSSLRRLYHASRWAFITLNEQTNRSPFLLKITSGARARGVRLALFTIRQQIGRRRSVIPCGVLCGWEMGPAMWILERLTSGPVLAYVGVRVWLCRYRDRL